MPQNPFNSLQTFDTGSGKTGKFYSLPQLEKEGIGPISKLPVSIRVRADSLPAHEAAQRRLPETRTKHGAPGA